MDRKTVHQQLLAAKDQLLHRQRLERQLAEAEQSLQSQKDSVLFLEKKWRSETDDVKRLMGMSVIALVTSVLGTKEQRLKKERQELIERA